jgi:hypothetical protein
MRRRRGRELAGYDFSTLPPAPLQTCRPSSPGRRNQEDLAGTAPAAPTRQGVGRKLMWRARPNTPISGHWPKAARALMRWTARGYVRPTNERPSYWLACDQELRTQIWSGLGAKCSTKPSSSMSISGLMLSSFAADPAGPASRAPQHQDRPVRIQTRPRPRANPSKRCGAQALRVFVASWSRRTAPTRAASVLPRTHPRRARSCSSRAASL